MPQVLANTENSDLAHPRQPRVWGVRQAEGSVLCFCGAPVSASAGWLAELWCLESTQTETLCYVKPWLSPLSVLGSLYPHSPDMLAH